MSQKDLMRHWRNKETGKFPYTVCFNILNGPLQAPIKIGQCLSCLESKQKLVIYAMFYQLTNQDGDNILMDKGILR